MHYRAALDIEPSIWRLTNWPVEEMAPAIGWRVPAGCGHEQANCSRPEKVEASIHVFDQSLPKQQAAIATHMHDSRMMYC